MLVLESEKLRLIILDPETHGLEKKKKKLKNVISVCIQEFENMQYFL